MSDQASFALRSRNPDVLTCIANLSNDEVFTPPEFANRMLDTLAEAWAKDHGGANLWADKSVKFLDLVWSASLGWLMFADVPTQTTLLGGAVICAATLWVARRER